MTSSNRPNPFQVFLGFVTNFFDTLGIGSFAPTTAVFKARRMVPDELIPGTLNVGHTPPTIIQAIIYITVIKVDVLTLVLLVTASAIGAWFGAGVVSGWSRRKVQRGMAIALLITATFFVLRLLKLVPPGADTLGLTGLSLFIGIIGNAFLGALMTVGVGLYAPCMAMVGMLGMNAKTAFPIMMGSCAVLMPVASLRFMRTGKYAKQAALGLAIGGIPGVLIAAFIVKELPLDWLKWIVVAVILYTAVVMWRASLQPKTVEMPVAPNEGEPAPVVP
jgi:uncharacterized membrane protein YfcA